MTEDKWNTLKEQFKGALAGMMSDKIDEMEKANLSDDERSKQFDLMLSRFIDNVTETTLQKEIPQRRAELRKQYEALVNLAYEEILAEIQAK